VRIGALLALAGVVAIAFVVRTVLVLALHRRRPTAAAAVDRWWPWAPLVVVLAYLVFTVPVLGILAVAATGFGLTRAGAIGSPFRPRG